MAKRVFLIVMDSVGIGEMPDASKWNDEGSNTLGVIRKHPAFSCPTLAEMGLCENLLRAPLTAITPENKNALIKTIKSLNFR